MKKLFLSLMMVAAIAACFTSCKKDANNESTTHSQTFTLGETSYEIDNAFLIENIQHHGEQVYNAIVVSKGQFVGDSGTTNQGAFVIFEGDITAGTYSLSGNEDSYPKYGFADISITDIINFNIHDLDDDNAYFATSGSVTIEINDNTYTVTTSNIEVENTQDPTIVETSSIDYEGTPKHYLLATVEEGSNLNDVEIATAGSTKLEILFTETQVVAFISINGSMLGFMSSTPFTDGIPTGEFTNSDYPIILIEAMNIQSLKAASSGNINITKDGDVYTIDITEAVINNQTYNMHYVGTMPCFEFPF